MPRYTEKETLDWMEKWRQAYLRYEQLKRMHPSDIESCGNQTPEVKDEMVDKWVKDGGWV